MRHAMYCQGCGKAGASLRPTRHDVPFHACSEQCTALLGGEMDRCGDTLRVPRSSAMGQALLKRPAFVHAHDAEFVHVSHALARHLAPTLVHLGQDPNENEPRKMPLSKRRRYPIFRAMEAGELAKPETREALFAMGPDVWANILKLLPPGYQDIFDAPNAKVSARTDVRAAQMRASMTLREACALYITDGGARDPPLDENATALVPPRVAALRYAWPDIDASTLGFVLLADPMVWWPARGYGDAWVRVVRHLQKARKGDAWDPVTVVLEDGATPASMMPAGLLQVGIWQRGLTRHVDVMDVQQETIEQLVPLESDETVDLFGFLLTRANSWPDGSPPVQLPSLSSSGPIAGLEQRGVNLGRVYEDTGRSLAHTLIQLCNERLLTPYSVLSQFRATPQVSFGGSARFEPTRADTTLTLAMGWSRERFAEFMALVGVRNETDQLMRTPLDDRGTTVLHQRWDDFDHLENYAQTLISIADANASSVFGGTWATMPNRLGLPPLLALAEADAVDQVREIVSRAADISRWQPLAQDLDGYTTATWLADRRFAGLAGDDRYERTATLTDLIAKLGNAVDNTTSPLMLRVLLSKTKRLPQNDRREVLRVVKAFLHEMPSGLDAKLPAYAEVADKMIKLGVNEGSIPWISVELLRVFPAFAKTFRRQVSASNAIDGNLMHYVVRHVVSQRSPQDVRTLVQRLYQLAPELVNDLDGAGYRPADYDRDMNRRVHLFRDDEWVNMGLRRRRL